MSRVLFFIRLHLYCSRKTIENVHLHSSKNLCFSSSSSSSSSLPPNNTGIRKWVTNRSNRRIHKASISESVQKPYDLPVSARYGFSNGVHKLWVYSTDNPFYNNSPTKHRTEIIVTGYDYSSGVRQFEGHGYVPYGTSGVSIMQVFGAANHATTFMLGVYSGSLYYYRETLLVENIYDRWFKLNVVHDVDKAKVQVYIDGELKHEAPGRGGTGHYFKCGVYAQDGDSYYMESRWKGIKVLNKRVM